jgi:phosphonate transport system substrate-binding protein
MQFHRIAMIAALLALPLIARAEDPKELLFIFQKQKDPAKIQADADKVAEFISREIGMPVKATLLLAEERLDREGVGQTFYTSIFVVKKDSPIKSVSDIIEKSKELRICFTSPTSTSGYIMPYYRFVKEGLLKPRQDVREVFKTVAFGGGYTQALEQLLNDRADVAVVSDYVLEGPKVDVYLEPEQREQLRVVDRTPGVPTHLIAARDGLSDELKAKVKAALLKIGEEQPELLADVYGASKFVEVDEDQHVAKAIEAIEYIGLPIENLAK